ncbi:uncharacterized protein EI97DRAFT_503486 [Westerdykella ornata]|uniref:Uncharacterized protein n=1 Tax=Westerdykella ornata TaxID=318751 RepID=A0A6A6JAW5_WESOR|nr:uncharacterized protein EI97DRAFT_503486 [Westerdykella ornata]KAF2273407.1 hypothetical protein EI97DRAFT_503486 [Westerdykella ornata]
MLGIDWGLLGVLGVLGLVVWLCLVGLCYSFDEVSMVQMESEPKEKKEGKEKRTLLRPPMAGSAIHYLEKQSRHRVPAPHLPYYVHAAIREFPGVTGAIEYLSSTVWRCEISIRACLESREKTCHWHRWQKRLMVRKFDVSDENRGFALWEGSRRWESRFTHRIP